MVYDNLICLIDFKEVENEQEDYHRAFNCSSAICIIRCRNGRIR